MSAKPLLVFGSSSELIHKSSSSTTSSLSGRRSTGGAFQLPTPSVQMRDWRNALRSQPTYKIGNRTFTFRLPNHVVLVMAVLLVVLLFFYLIHPTAKLVGSSSQPDYNAALGGHPYNHTYPLTAPVLHAGNPTYKIAIIADLDTNSKSRASGNTWVSYLKMGHLSHNRNSGAVAVTWDSTEPVELSSHFALKGEYY